MLPLILTIFRNIGEAIALTAAAGRVAVACEIGRKPDPADLKRLGIEKLPLLG